MSKSTTMTPTILPDRLAQIEAMHLGSGSHDDSGHNDVNASIDQRGGTLPGITEVV